LLFADGNNSISKRQNRISINLQEKDKYILEKLRDLIAPTSKLFLLEKNKKNKNHQNAYLLSISSKKLCNQLNNLGCVPNKSLILHYPNCIPNDLEHHFIRGYFDGDGCITQWSKRPKYKKITIISTFNFCKEMQNIFMKNNLKCGLLLSKNGITTTLYMGSNNNIYCLFKWLYKDATIFLERKYKKFMEINIKE